MSNLNMEINDLCGYVFLRCKEEGETEVLSAPKDQSTLVWVNYDTSSGEKVYFKGRSIQEYHAREFNEEIVISRANGYTVKVLEVPLDYENNPNAKPKEYVLLSLGK